MGILLKGHPMHSRVRLSVWRPSNLPDHCTGSASVQGMNAHIRSLKINLSVSCFSTFVNESSGGGETVQLWTQRATINYQCTKMACHFHMSLYNNTKPGAIPRRSMSQLCCKKAAVKWSSNYIASLQVSPWQGTAQHLGLWQQHPAIFNVHPIQRAFAHLPNISPMHCPFPNSIPFT